MGKIVKYCSACDEDWAEKFGFCPTCGATLDTFEMQRVAPEAAASEAAPAESPAVTEPETANVQIEEAAAPEEASAAEDERFEPVAPAAVSIPAFTAPAMDADAVRPAPSYPPLVMHDHQDDVFQVTQIKPEGTGRLLGLLLGALVLVNFVLLGGVVANIFAHDTDIGAINDDLYNASLLELEPMTVEEEQQKKEKDDAGGGGGGGREEKEPVTKGDLANQTENPIRPPQVTHRLDDPALTLPPASTQGNKKFEQKYDRYGDPNGQFINDSNGLGSGGGQGNGRGTGQGNGNGTGAGNGNGSGFGNGNGDGNGNGNGSGNDGVGEPPPVKVGVTAGLKILSKPKPGYTDAARQAQVQGTVILRVTFLASGGIGSVSVVKGLPNGLSEQAMAAARRISFTPAMSNGVPATVTKQVEYSFSIY